MSEKQLSDAEWKKFSKGRNYKDAALLKAIGALAKAEKGSPDEQLEALDEMEKQADQLRKANKADKELGSWLDDFDKALARERKAAQQEAKDAAKKSTDDEDDEADSPALLTSKMKPLVRQVPKGDAMQVMIAVTSKQAAVLMSRRAISPARRKVLVEYLGGVGGIKYVTGQCIFENNAHTFVVQGSAAGLAKKIKAALLQQVELRIKVRVRGEDPNDVEEEGEEDSGAGGPDVGGTDETPMQTGDIPAPPKAPEPPPTPLSPEEKAKADFEARWARLEPQALQAIKEQKGDVTRMRAVMGFASQKSTEGDYKAALQSLNMLERLLAGDDPGAQFGLRLPLVVARVKDAVAAGHPKADDARLKTSEAGVFARKKEFDKANALLDEVETLLAAPVKETPPGGGDTPTEGGDAPSVGGDDPTGGVDRSKAFNARLAAMQPAIKAAMAGPLAAEVKPLIAAIAAAKGKVELAEAALDRIEALLERAGQVKTVDEAEWQRQLNAIESQYTEVLGSKPTDATKMRATMAYATEQAEAGEYTKAVAALKQLQKMLDAAVPEQQGEDTGRLVKQRAFLVQRWSRIPGELRAELQSLRQAIESSEADADPDELVDGIEAALEELLEELQDEIDDSINEGDTSNFEGLRARTRNDPLLVHLQNAPAGNGANMLNAIITAIDELESALTAP